MSDVSTLKIPDVFIILEASSGKEYLFKKDLEGWGAYDINGSHCHGHWEGTTIRSRILQKIWKNFRPFSKRFDEHKKRLLSEPAE